MLLQKGFTEKGLTEFWEQTETSNKSMNIQLSSYLNTAATKLVICSFWFCK